MAHPGGRPSVMTKEVIAKLEEAFSNGASDLEACFLANISKDSLYRYQNEHPEFCERKEMLKDQIKYQARKVIKAALDAGDKQMATWYADRRIKEFKPKQDVTSGDKPLPIIPLNVQPNFGDQPHHSPEEES